MTNQTQVLIDVALLEEAAKALAPLPIGRQLAALIPTGPAEARELLARALNAGGYRRLPANVRDGKEEEAVEVIHTALNEPRPMTAEVEAAFDTLSPLHVYANYSLALDILTAQFQPARKPEGTDHA